jgi:hypothetical protein
MLMYFILESTKIFQRKKKPSQMRFFRDDDKITFPRQDGNYKNYYKATTENVTVTNFSLTIRLS